MISVGRILGTEVGSTAPVFLAFLAVHVLAALTAVVTGAVAGLARKGTPRHICFGRWYFRAIGTVVVTAIALTAMRPRQDFQLALIGLVALAAATIGRNHRHRHRPGDTPHITGMGVSYIAMLTAFYVDNGPRLPLWDKLPTVAFWLLPAAIGIPITARAVRRYRRRAAAASTVTTHEEGVP